MVSRGKLRNMRKCIILFSYIFVILNHGYNIECYNVFINDKFLQGKIGNI